MAVCDDTSKEMFLFCLLFFSSLVSVVFVGVNFVCHIIVFLLSFCMLFFTEENWWFLTPPLPLKWSDCVVKALPIVFVNWQQIWQLMLPKWLGKTTSLPKELQFSENVYAPFLISDIFALFWDLLAYLALSNKFYFCWFLSIWVWPPKLNSAFWNIWLITVNS